MQPRYALDAAFYDRVRAAKPSYTMAESFVIPPYSGRGFIAKKGQTFRVVEETGPQIADVAIWNADDVREQFSAMRTWLLDGWIIRKNSRMWSELPWLRPMATCIDDTVVAPAGCDYHHHFVGTHCGPETVEKRFGIPGLNGCRVNLLQGIEPFGLTEDDLRENINLHELNRMDPVTGRRAIARGDAKTGDYVEFYAEMDLLVSVSVCPFGDGSHNPTMWRENVVRPLRVEVYETGIQPKAFPARMEPRAAEPNPRPARR
ncbi:MAG: urea carboxylase-associated family protein [Rhodospirillales bacterium]|nr:urea carboxylase-associated family protein [Rhodospirillales bacterium]